MLKTMENILNIFSNSLKDFTVRKFLTYTNTCW